ncbi:MAG: histidinol-phosphate transaminase [Pseudomonadota bacterium]
MQPVPHVAALDAYALAELETGTVSLAQNESLRAPSPNAIAAATQAAHDGALYPDPDWRALRTVISEVYGLDPDGVLCGAGSMELIAALARTYLAPGSQVLTTRYAYLFFRTAARMCGAEISIADEPGLTVDVALILAKVTPATRMVFVVNPGNPTGTVIPLDELRDLRRRLADDVLLIVDEAYGEFVDPDRPTDGAFDLVAEGKTVVLRTLSKAYGLAGLRVGWGAFPPEIACDVRKTLTPNNIAAASLAMAAAAVRDQPYMRETVRLTQASRDSFAKACRANGLAVPSSRANFILLPFASADAAGQADQALRAAGYSARGMGGYALPDCLRITIAAPEVMQRVAAHLGDHLPGAPAGGGA